MSDRRKVLVTGAGGFIGHHLVSHLQELGYWVRGVDLKYPEFGLTTADEFTRLDLRQPDNCRQAAGCPSVPTTRTLFPSESVSDGPSRSIVAQIRWSTLAVNPRFRSTMVVDRMPDASLAAGILAIVCFDGSAASTLFPSWGCVARTAASASVPTITASASRWVMPRRLSHGCESLAWRRTTERLSRRA